MKKLLGLVSAIGAVVLLNFISGCATLNKSECQVANWEIIGMEDASAGRPSSYVSQHRSACAEHGISPDLSMYMRGYEKGLAQYCTYQNGLNIGAQGRNNSGICTGTSAQEFARGFELGRQDFELRAAINSLRDSIARHHSRLKSIDQQIDRKEDAIVATNNSPEMRRQLLQEIESLRAEKSNIEVEIPNMEGELFRLEDEYARLKQ